MQHAHFCKCLLTFPHLLLFSFRAWKSICCFSSAIFLNQELDCAISFIPLYVCVWFFLSKSKCAICGLSDARYRCPGCHMQTCSVSCVKQHKQISGCTGQRDKTNYVPIREFTETHLLSGKCLGRQVASFFKEQIIIKVLFIYHNHTKELTQCMWIHLLERSVSGSFAELKRDFLSANTLSLSCRSIANCKHIYIY